MKKWLMLISIVFCLQLSAEAQIKKTLHQVFKLDTTETLLIGLWDRSDTYNWEVVAWPSQNIMVETVVSLNQASLAVLNFLTEQKRYNYKLERIPGQVRLINQLDERPEIKTQEQMSTEDIQIRIFIPEYLVQEGEFTWKKSKK